MKDLAASICDAGAGQSFHLPSSSLSVSEEDSRLFRGIFDDLSLTFRFAAVAIKRLMKMISD